MKALFPLLLSACVSFELVTPPINPSGLSGCVPQSCEALDATCGRQSDGCQGSQLCGFCAAPHACAGGVCTVNGAQLATPVLAAPATTSAPKSIVTGTAQPLVSVRIFANSACTGEPVATVNADANGAFSATLTLTDQAHVLYADARDPYAGNASACSGGIPHNRSALLVSAPVAVMGNVLIGQSSTAAVLTVTNGGAQATSPLSAQITGNAADFTFINNCSGVVLAAGGTCQVSVTATPMTSGQKSVTLTIAGQPGGSVSFTATATGRARLTVNVHERGLANGRVVAGDGSLDCTNGICTADYAGGVVVLSASVQSGVFSGWLGACASAATACDVEMSTNRSVDATFAMANIAFQSSRAYTMPFAASAGDALIKADAECTEMARAVGLPGTFVAWMSTSGVDALTRLGLASGWISVTNKTIATSRVDLLATHFRYSLVFDEHGTYGDNFLLTGSHADGTVSSTNCSDFTSASGSDLTLGWAASAEAWSEIGNNFSCDPTSFWFTSNRVRLACFQIDSQAGAPMPIDVGRYAFVSAATFAPGPGHGTVAGALVDADSICQLEAASLPGGAGGGTFSAFLATSTSTAEDRFPASATAWVRPDGVLLSPTPAGFTRRTQRWSALRMNANGTFVDGFVYTGTSRGDTAVTTAETCTDWLNGNGSSSDKGQAWSAYANDEVTTYNQACDVALPLVCLEN